MTQPTPNAELLAAVRRLRDTGNCSGYRLDCDSSELLDMIRVLLRARAPLADLLEQALEAFDGQDMPEDEPALVVARAVNGPARAGPALGGAITDHQAGRQTP